MTIGRATYDLGWKWSNDLGPLVGAGHCPVEHVGLVISSSAAVTFDDGRVVELKPGDLFHVPPIPHDSGVIGDQPIASLSRRLKNTRKRAGETIDLIAASLFSTSGSKCIPRAHPVRTRR